MMLDKGKNGLMAEQMARRNKFRSQSSVCHYCRPISQQASNARQCHLGFAFSSQ